MLMHVFIYLHNIVSIHISFYTYVSILSILFYLSLHLKHFHRFSCFQVAASLKHEQQNLPVTPVDVLASAQLLVDFAVQGVRLVPEGYSIVIITPSAALCIVS